MFYIYISKKLIFWNTCNARRKTDLNNCFISNCINDCVCKDSSKRRIILIPITSNEL